MEGDVAVRSKNETGTAYKLFYSLYKVLQIKKLKIQLHCFLLNPLPANLLNTYLTQWLIDVLPEWLAERDRLTEEILTKWLNNKLAN